LPQEAHKKFHTTNRYRLHGELEFCDTSSDEDLPSDQELIDSALNPDPAIVKEQFSNIEGSPRGPNWKIIPEIKLLRAYWCLGERAILSEAPCEGLLGEFFSMAYKHSDTIISLFQDEEIDLRAQKNKFFQKIATRYYAPGNREYMVKNTYNRYEVTTHFIQVDPNIIRSTISIYHQSDRKRKRISHYRCTNWKDCTAGNLQTIVKLAHIALKAKMPIIHCWAGLGRSGTLAMIVSVFEKIKRGDVFPEIVPHSLISLRKERPFAVGTLDQYKTIYSAVKILCKKNDKRLEKIFSKTKEELHAEHAKIACSPFSKTISPDLVFPYVHEAYLAAPYAQYCLDKTLILCSAPRRDSMKLFSEMLYKNADAVIILMRPDELDKWSNEQLQIYNTLPDVLKELHFIRAKKLKLSTNHRKHPPKVISIYQYNDWTDNEGAPPKHMAALARLAMQHKKAVIHPPTGVERSGTLAAVISAYKRIKMGNYNENVIENAVRDLRNEWPMASYTPALHECVYKAVEFLLREDGDLNGD